MNKEQIAQIVTPVAVPLVVSLFKLIWPKVPKATLPFLCPVLGALIDVAASGTVGIGTAWGALLGTAGIGLREAYDQTVGAEGQKRRADGGSSGVADAAKALLVLAIPGALLFGCAHLQSGADPFVVRVEQAQTVAAPSFDLVLRVDQANRPFWKTNAPEFHKLCEWLRTPVPYSSSNIQRVLAIQANVSDLKIRYKSSKTPENSNLLWSAWAVLDEAGKQANSWATIVTNTAPWK